jgi:tetratricopeptide (TPR) repeat protein
VIAHLNAKNYERGRQINELIRQDFEFTADDYTNEGFIKNQSHQHQEAISSYQKALELTPNHLYALNNLGYSLAAIDDNEEALSFFEKVISISPQFAPAYSNRGWVKMKIGMLEDGLQDVNYSLQLNPTDAESYRNLGFYHMEKGEFADAIELFQKAKEMEEDIPFIDEYFAEAISRQQMAITSENNI